MHQHRGDLRRIRLQELESVFKTPLRELQGELPGSPGQHVARLLWRRGDPQRSFGTAGIVARELLQLSTSSMMRSAASSTIWPGAVRPFTALAMPREDRNTELLLELDDCLGHAGLRRVQRARGPRSG